MNTNNLKSSKFHKMMQDAGVVRVANPHNPMDENMLNEKKRIDLIFCQANHHKANMNFETFLHTLTKIAQFKFGNSNSNQVQSLHELMDKHMIPLFQKIDAQKKYVNKEKNFEIAFDELIAIILKSGVGHVLFEIYNLLF